MTSRTEGDDYPSEAEMDRAFAASYPLRVPLCLPEEGPSVVYTFIPPALGEEE